MSEDENTFESWAIVELLGHVKIAGQVSEEEHFGGKIGRIDIPVGEDKYVTQYFGHSSIYRITPCTEEMARTVSKFNMPKPVHHFELSASVSIPEEREEWDHDLDEDF